MSLSAGLAATHAVLLAGAATLVIAAAPAPDAVVALAPPTDRPLLLSRTLTRELPGGKAIVATRRYRIVFARTASGWRIDGTLVASEIAAPPALAALAELERTRPDDGLFPIALDAAGRIVSASGGAQGRTQVERAIVAVRAKLPGEPLPGVAAGSAGALTRWPETLFLPVETRAANEQRFPLPDGSEGKITVTLASAAAEALATMGRAERTVTTEVGGTRRISRESWSLSALEETLASSR